MLLSVYLNRNREEKNKKTRNKRIQENKANVKLKEISAEMQLDECKNCITLILVRRIANSYQYPSRFYPIPNRNYREWHRKISGLV